MPDTDKGHLMKRIMFLLTTALIPFLLYADELGSIAVGETIMKSVSVTAYYATQNFVWESSDSRLDVCAGGTTYRNIKCTSYFSGNQRVKCTYHINTTMEILGIQLQEDGCLAV